MSLAQPTLDLLMLEQISELKNTLEKLNASILSVNESVNEKLSLLNSKVDKQDEVIQKLLNTRVKETNEKQSEEKVDITGDKINKIKEDIDINDKNVKLNRKEIENLYRVLNTYKDENKEVVKEIESIKTKMTVLNDSSSENSVKIMNTLNNYILELKSTKAPTSYANITNQQVEHKTIPVANQSYPNKSVYQSNNYRRNSYNNSNNRYSSPKENDEDGWQTVKSKKKSTNFRRY